MPDPATLVVSVILSGSVSVATASWVAGRQERGRRQFDARRAVREAAGGLLRAVREAELGMDVPVGLQSDALVTDYLFSSQVHIASEQLGSLRRWVVHRRLRRIVGPIAFDLGRELPVSDRQETTDPMVAAIIAGGKSGKYNIHELGGLRRRALEAGVEHGYFEKSAMVRLRKELSRLAFCRIFPPV